MSVNQIDLVAALVSNIGMGDDADDAFANVGAAYAAFLQKKTELETHTTPEERIALLRRILRALHFLTCQEDFMSERQPVWMRLSLFYKQLYDNFAQAARQANPGQLNDIPFPDRLHLVTAEWIAEQPFLTNTTNRTSSA